MNTTQQTTQKTLKEELEFLKQIVSDKYNYELKNPTDKGAAKWQRIAVLRENSEVMNRLEGIMERHF